jgi:hypothetical protein
MRRGTKLQVFRGSRDITPGGLRKADLIKSKKGKVVSKKMSALAKRKNNLGSFLIRPRGRRKRKPVKRYKP